MPQLDPNVRRYYDRGIEADRLLGGFPSGPLEFERTKEIVSRYLPPPRLRILDVGGGPGIYSAWLAARGDDVVLIDPVTIHVEQAAAADPRVRTEVGDARELKHPSGSADAVLLMGPLYHLVDRVDRMLALAEAFRVLRPGGFVFAAAINRFAALLDLLVRAGKLHEPGVFDGVRTSVETGVFRGSTSNLFTTAYFHLPAELAEEVEEAGFKDTAVFGIEGPGALQQNFSENWADPQRRAAILDAARLVESRPEMQAAAGHLLAVGRKEL